MGPPGGWDRRTPTATVDPGPSGPSRHGHHLPPTRRPAPRGRSRRVNRGLLWASALAVVVLAVATIVAFTAGDGGSRAGDVQQIDPNGTQPLDDSLTGRDVTGEALPAVSYKTFDGNRGATEHRGTPLVINFWSSSCAPCIKEMPDLESIYQANGDSVAFLGVEVSERAESGLRTIAAPASPTTGRRRSAEVFRAWRRRAPPYRAGARRRHDRLRQVRRDRSRPSCAGIDEDLGRW